MKNEFQIPADVEVPVRHPRAVEPGQPIRLHHSVCFGCGDDAPVGLHIQVIAGEGVTVSAQMPVEAWMQGGPGVIHGGLLTAAFDEVLGTAPLQIGMGCVTVHLEVDFALPIPLGSVLQFDAEIVGVQRRKIYVRGVAHVGDPAAPVAAAHAIFVKIDPREHFAEYMQHAVGTDSARLK